MWDLGKATSERIALDVSHGCLPYDSKQTTDFTKEDVIVSLDPLQCIVCDL